MIILMGQYTVVNRGSSAEKKIEIPGVQTCVVIVLQSPEGIGVAHVDTPFHAQSVVRDMIEKLGNMIDAATLVGGDVAISRRSSRSIYKPIYEVLKKHAIPYVHSAKSYHIPLFPILRNFDVSVSVPQGGVTFVVNNPANSERLLESAPQQQIDFLCERMSIDPRNPNNAPRLAMQFVPPRP